MAKKKIVIKTQRSLLPPLVRSAGSGAFIFAASGLKCGTGNVVLCGTGCVLLCAACRGAGIVVFSFHQPLPDDPPQYFFWLFKGESVDPQTDRKERDERRWQHSRRGMLNYLVRLRTYLFCLLAPFGALILLAPVMMPGNGAEFTRLYRSPPVLSPAHIYSLPNVAVHCPPPRDFSHLRKLIFI